MPRVDTDTYLIRYNDDGTVDVLKNRRAFSYDIDFDEAMDRIRRREGRGFTVDVEAADGTRSKERT